MAAESGWQEGVQMKMFIWLTCTEKRLIHMRMAISCSVNVLWPSVYLKSILVASGLPVGLVLLL